MPLSEFLLLIRRKAGDSARKTAHNSCHSFNSKWNSWVTGLAVKDQLSGQLKRWDTQGKIIRGSDQVTPGPYLDHEDYIFSVIIIYAIDYQEAKEIAYSCPIFELDGSVEVRMSV